jgi:hypothetical protein
MRHLLLGAAVRAAILCACLFVGITGIDALVAARPALVAPLVHLHVVLTVDSSLEELAPFERTSTDATRITQFYDALSQLQPLDLGTTLAFDCQSEPGILYHLTFTRANGTQIGGLIAVDGCGWAGLTNSRTGVTSFRLLVDGGDLWAAFAAAVGVPWVPFGTATSAGYAPVSTPPLGTP